MILFTYNGESTASIEHGPLQKLFNSQNKPSQITLHNIQLPLTLINQRRLKQWLYLKQRVYPLKIWLEV